MRIALILLAIALAANAHWTHDDSLAQEIGPPPGEEDVDVASLSDELVSTSEGAGNTDKTYRVTFGTKPNGGSTSIFRMSMAGADGTMLGNVEPRYYSGPFMTYDNAADMAPALKLGMTPIIDTTTRCSGLDKVTRQPKTCEANAEQSKCEPNGKDCVAAMAAPSKVGYVNAEGTTLCKTADCGSQGSLGPIQRGQISMANVGEITAVKMKDGTDFSQANDCMKNNPSQSSCTTEWKPAFIKINTNSPTTGIGNGIYYITPQDGLKVGSYQVPSGNNVPAEVTTELLAKPRDISTTSGFPADESFNALLEKCMAQTCEEEMDARLGMMSMMDEFGEAYAREAF